MYDLRFCLLSFGQQLAKGRDGYKAGLRGAKLRPAGVCNVEPCGIFDCKLPHSHMTYRAAACEGTRYAGLREAKLRPADGLRHRHSDMQSPVQPAAERRDLHKPFGEMQLSANGRLRAAAHMCEFADGTKAIRRCRPPHRAADGTRRSNGVTRQDGITRSIDCSVFLFGQRHKSPSREPRYGFRLFAMIFKTSLAELYRA